MGAGIQQRTNAWLLSRLNDLWENHFADIPQPNRLFISFGRRAKFRFGSIRLEQFTQVPSPRTPPVSSLSLTVPARIAAAIVRVPAHAGHQTIITITSLFQNSRIPVAVVDYTIAHELIHYAHGFSSPLPQKFHHPHKGGIVHREMKTRGIGELVVSYKKWIKEYRNRLK